MVSLAVAVLLGVAAFPLVLVFHPVYFPWSLFVLACSGGVVGLTITPRSARSRFLRPIGLAVVVVAAALIALVVTANLRVSRDLVLALPWWIGWLLLPVGTGVYAGASLRASMGAVRGAAVAAGIAVAIGLSGAGLAFAVAPAEVMGAPSCAGGFECPRTQCAYMAERRRFLAIERVVAYDGTHITCTYTAWGGIDIGRADMSSRGGSWTDGSWPKVVSGRRD